MLDIDDDGKIWLRGCAKPDYGIRIGTLYFVIGKEDSEKSNCFIHENYLAADLHNQEEQYRIVRRFCFDLEPRSSGTLFSGFKKTKHADIKAVTHRDERVEQFVIDGRNYLLNSNRLIDPIQIINIFIQNS